MAYLLSDDLGHHIPGVDVDGADGHDLLTVPWRELANKQGDECIELAHLLLVVLLHGILIALLEAGKRHGHVHGPPDLGASESHLERLT